MAEPILQWVEFLGLNSVQLSRHYRDWRDSFRGNATGLLGDIFKGCHDHLVFRRLQNEPPGVVFRSYRRRAGVPVAEVVRALGVERRVYGEWESGHNAPQVSRALTETGWIGAELFAREVPKTSRPVGEARRAKSAPPTGPIPLRCERHSVSAHPEVVPVVACEEGRRYRAVSEDGTARGNLTPCAIIAANDAYFASRYTGKGFCAARA
ncbi:helix-turn-helix domain-containing protein [Kitasatospora sp. NPDC088134]|uniref:helix-turn-helix domain-containing protein n=1 Tax=Kitasatospora sp. NPDC088134 TaxID=3364071 RepID=UPI00382CC821